MDRLDSISHRKEFSINCSMESNASIESILQSKTIYGQAHKIIYLYKYKYILFF